MSLIPLISFANFCVNSCISAAGLPLSISSPGGNIFGSDSTNTTNYSASSQAQAPSPMLLPFVYKSVPTLSGQCAFNFSAAESILKVTATDCWSSLAPYLANAVCCPQYDATFAILLGQSSKYTGMLSMNETHASHCISDVDKILISQGADENLQKICSITQSNLTGASCLVIDANEVDRILATSELVAACGQLDTANECCSRNCQNSISAATARLASSSSRTTSTNNPILPKDSVVLRDCTNIVLRWLASKLDPPAANRVLRTLSSCTLNEGCPLVLPDINQISKECQTQTAINQTSCCNAMESYMSPLQEQSFITDSQALNCAASLSMRLQKANISTNIYNLCRIHLKDFSIQVDTKESGCLLPSTPSDVIFDESSGIGFRCKLEENSAAPWSSSLIVSNSTCNKSTSTAATLPEIPKPVSAQRGMEITSLLLPSLFFISLII
ncbi:OLC1v1024979C1 [Oldenlandia corymbosa var. corymbosa]|uniref:OLC1v1024979C1 n=1 Tax=Oldenlandia corymbosa var. corymbosa TaxID=529605 RepID=A0AAV1C5C8_OLDCO|nr:OLC1v1024979C1 [Oldenlandia corymbosa var. corymbosa]